MNVAKQPPSYSDPGNAGPGISPSQQAQNYFLGPNPKLLGRTQDMKHPKIQGVEFLGRFQVFFEVFGTGSQGVNSIFFAVNLRFRGFWIAVAGRLFRKPTMSHLFTYTLIFKSEQQCPPIEQERDFSNL